MSEEKQIEEFKPSGWLYVFLFIYYSIWLLQGFGATSHYCTFGFDEFQKYGIAEWLFLPVYLIAAFYSLYAVIKTLRGDKDCITALKWSLIIIFIYTCCDGSRGQIATYNLWIWGAAFFARPLFYLAFYLYLCFANGIKLRYPKEKRRFSPAGWGWVGILSLFLVLSVVGGIKQHKIHQYCKKVDLSQLNLHDGEISDGYILFKSDRKWHKWEQPPDTLWIDERIETLPSLASEDSTSIIYLMSGQCHTPDARTHNQIIVASRSILRQNGINSNMSDVNFTDTIINGNKLLATTLESRHGSTLHYVTVMSITDSISPKCGVFVRIDKGGYDSDWSVNFAKRIRFDLKNIAEGQNDETGNKAKHSEYNGISYNNGQADANLLTSLPNGFLPRFSIRIMHPKNCEGEIADCKRYNVFNHL